MDRKRFDDGQLDRLLSESLGCEERPPAELVAETRRRMRRAAPGRPSLWWLPALGGTAVSAMLLYVLSLTAMSWRCFAAGAVVLGACTASSWVITTIGYFLSNTFKEESRLI